MRVTKIRMRAPSGLRLCYESPEHSVGVIGNILLSYSIAEPDRDYLRATNSELRAAAREFDKVAVVVVIHEDAKPPSDAAREALAENNRLFHGELGDKISMMLQVIEGTGFVAAAKRGAMSLIGLTSRYPFRVKVVSRIEDAADALVANELVGALNRAEIVTASDYLRSLCPLPHQSSSTG